MKVLLVDDEPRVLAAHVRHLRRHCDVVTAAGGAEALTVLDGDEPVAVIVSDMQMPHMSGLELLAEVQERSPGTVRMMLTGNGDLATAVAAVNEGRVFRFLTKPCPSEVLASAIDDGLEMHRLRRSEQELLHDTLNGTVRLLTEMVSLVDGATQSLVPHIRDNMTAIGRALGVDDWTFDVAAMVCELGNLTLPRGLVDDVVSGRPLDDASRELAARGPLTIQRLLGAIPRLVAVGDMVGGSVDPAAVDDIDEPGLGALMLHYAVVWARMQAAGADGAGVAARLSPGSRRHGRLGPVIVDALAARSGPAVEERELEIRRLGEAMELLDDVTTDDGALLLAAGTVLSGALIERLANYRDSVGVREPVRVRVAVP